MQYYEVWTLRKMGNKDWFSKKKNYLYSHYSRVLNKRRLLNMSSLNFHIKILIHFYIGEHSYMTSDVFRHFWPTYPPSSDTLLHNLFSKIRWGLTYLPTQKSDVIYECSLVVIFFINISKKKIWFINKCRPTTIRHEYVDTFGRFLAT
jgi:hypothetical protein